MRASSDPISMGLVNTRHATTRGVPAHSVHTNCPLCQIKHGLQCLDVARHAWAA